MNSTLGEEQALAPDVQALLAYVRALRAALDETGVALRLRTVYGKPPSAHENQVIARAAELLAAVGAAAGAAPEREEP